MLLVQKKNHYTVNVTKQTDKIKAIDFVIIIIIIIIFLKKLFKIWLTITYQQMNKVR